MRAAHSIFLAGAWALLGFGGTMAGEEKPAEAAPASIGKAGEALTIDGVLNEPAWASATVVRGDYINSKKGELSEAPRLAVKYTWDDHYLYIGYETFDKNVVAVGSNAKEGPENNKREGLEIWSADPKAKVDVVEFFISFGDEHFFWEIHHNAANQFNDVWCTTVDPSWPIAKSSLAPHGILFNFREFILDSGEQTLAMGAKLKPAEGGALSTVNKSDDTDTGYIGELRIPWAGLGAPLAARPDAKKKETAWKMEGVPVRILAVVQDGDLAERYHHSSPTRKGDWFHKTVALWPRYLCAKATAQIERKPAGRMDEISPEALAAQIIQRIDRREPLGDLLQQAVNGGAAVAQACAAGLSADAPQRWEPLHEVIAASTRRRRSHRELLRLYDPAGFALFYSEAGAAAQRPFAFALPLKEWTKSMPEALINAAPIPLLDWMRAQAASASPDLGKLRQIWTAWGMTVFFQRERQHVAALRELAVAFERRPQIQNDPAMLGAWLRFAGEVGAAANSEAAIHALRHAEPAVRAEAWLALQRFGGERMPAALSEAAANESVVPVMLRAAEAFGAWSDDPAAGAAALALFERTTSPDVRRALLFSATRASWPQRSALVKKAFDVPENGVLGIALQAINASSDAETRAKTLAMVKEYPSPPSVLIDALGGLRDPATAGYLVKALKESQNLSIRLKIMLALERIGGDEARAALLVELRSTVTPLLAQHLAAIAGRIRLAGAEETLIVLAEDPTAPLPVRVQCLWSLGAFREENVRAALKRMDAEPAKYFAEDEAKGDLGTFEQIEQARMLIKMARVQLGEAGAAEEAGAMYARATPTTKVSMLMLLSNVKLDHAVIAEGLASSDFAVMLAAVHAAGAAAPGKYHAALMKLQKSPHVGAILSGGVDLNDLDSVLGRAIAAGK